MLCAQAYYFSACSFAPFTDDHLNHHHLRLSANLQMQPENHRIAILYLQKLISGVVADLNEVLIDDRANNRKMEFLDYICVIISHLFR